MNGIRQILSLWRTWVIILTPLLLLPMPVLFDGDRAAKCAYIIIIMATYWMTEAIPMAATALLPIALMPWLGVMGSKDLCKNYLKDTNMLFVGGLLVAVAVEKWDLHKRIALGVLLFVGSKPKWLMFGFMITTAFLSMWLSNTATTAMMIPITQAVLAELDNHRKDKRQIKHSAASGQERRRKQSTVSILPPDPEYYEQLASRYGHVIPENMMAETSLCSCAEQDRVAEHVDPTEVKIVGYSAGAQSEKKMSQMETQSHEQAELIPPEEPLTDEEIEEDNAFNELCKGLTLCVAYAANIGGTATLTGTGPNLIVKGQVDTLYGSDSGLNFSSWFVLAFPNMMISLILAWLWLQALFLGKKELFSCLMKDTEGEDKTANEVIKREYEKLGPWSFAEIATLCHFIILAVLWLTREPEFMPGWATLFPEGFVTDASVAMSVGLALFVFPSKKPNILCFRSAFDDSEPGPVAALLDWDIVHKKMPWGVIIVLGGGFALADACKASGLSGIIGNAFYGFEGIPSWSLVLVLIVITTVFTNVASNTATATIFLPILAELAVAIHVNPFYLMLPVTIATSLAFMLPVATPPNAMVFAYGHMKIIDMMKAGFFMNILCILVLTVSINSYGYAYFNLGTFPAWAGPDAVSQANSTLLSTTIAITDVVKNSSLIL